MVSQSGSLGFTIKGKTADLTDVQKTVIAILHQEGKPQKVMAEEACCIQRAVFKLNEGWVAGESVVEKGAQMVHKQQG